MVLIIQKTILISPISLIFRHNFQYVYVKTYDFLKGAVEICSVEMWVQGFPDRLPLERGGESAREAQNVDERCDASGPGLGAQHFAPHGMAHGDVALHSERNRQPYRRAACGHRANNPLVNCEISLPHLPICM
jgi:hypothetical protein